MPGRRRPGRSALVPMAVVVATLLAAPGSPPAFAAWTANGAGSGQAAAGSLAGPTGVSASCDWPLSADLSWNGVPHAEAYAVARSTNGTTWTTIGTTTGTSLNDAALPALLGLTVRWRVTAIAGTAWNSAPSASSNALLVTALGMCVPL
jgi:hypothetical protein